MKGFGQMKSPMTSSGMEPATFRLVATLPHKKRMDEVQQHNICINRYYVKEQTEPSVVISLTEDTLGNIIVQNNPQENL
jgi:hypothetical protein